MIEITIERYNELIRKELRLEILMEELERTYTTSYEKTDHLLNICKVLFGDPEDE